MNILSVRDEAWSASGPAHARIKREWDVYHNEVYPQGERIARNMEMRVDRSLNPQIQTGILRLVSPFMEQAARMEIQPDRSDILEEDLVFTEDLQNWNQMMEEADNETETIKNLILHNLVSGTAIAKTYFDPRTRIMRSEAVHPTQIAVDGGASRIDLSDASAVCQRYWHDEFYLKRHYDWRPKKPTRRFQAEALRYNAPTHQLDEVWMRRELAEDCTDIDTEALEDVDKQIIRAVMIDDEVVSVKGTPFWWPDFPFAMWRNFTSSFDTLKVADFWGFGYGTLLLPQQKFLDEMLATLVSIARKLPVGQVVTTEGALDREQVHNIDSQVIELLAGKDIGVDFQKLPIDQIPPVFGEMIQYITQAMQERMPSLAEVFTGESPGAGSSGRAINSLQWAAFTQLSENIKGMNEFRRRRVQQRLTGIQQTAKKPLAQHIWRGGLDLPDYFPEEARYVGFDVVAADSSAMPHSPMAKLQVLQTFAAMGWQMTLEEALKFTGFDKGYGLTPNMFIDAMQMGMPPMQMGGNEQVIAGAEAPLP